MTTKARIITLLFSLLIAGLLSFSLKHYYDKAGRLSVRYNIRMRGSR